MGFQLDRSIIQELQQKQEVAQTPEALQWVLELYLMRNELKIKKAPFSRCL